MGATTYEQVQSFGQWPYGDQPTYVLTGRNLSRATEQVRLCERSVDELARRLTAEYGHVWLVGGAATAQSCVARGLVDELRLTLAPVVRGSGVALFDGGERPARSHRETTTYDSGLVELRYDVSA